MYYKMNLNIHITSFKPPQYLIRDSTTVCVGIMTFPEEEKHIFEIKGKELNSSSLVFPINVTEKTDKIAILINKKALIAENPIIATATFHFKELFNIPIQKIVNNKISSDIKILDIHYPLKKQIKEERKNKVKQFKRKVLGQMEVRLTFPTSNNVNSNDNNKKIFNIQRQKENNRNSYQIKKLNQKKNNEFGAVSIDNCFVSEY
ncbi:hypothetical protein M9Y10_024529 [Tritrichomonas musculus]|uniref:Uncharacterized protein n=1 Tax=Tritrichomonas musculus TaxID=1915356 RepID=A0ABR2HC83_9EUKA